MDTIKALADGQLEAAKTTLYTAGAGVTTAVTKIFLVNSDVVARTVNLYYKRSAGISRRLTPVDLSLNAGEAYELEGPVNLEAAGEIEGDASAANVVDYVISGIEHKWADLIAGRLVVRNRER